MVDRLSEISRNVSEIFLLLGRNWQSSPMECIFNVVINSLFVMNCSAMQTTNEETSTTINMMCRRFCRVEQKGRTAVFERVGRICPHRDNDFVLCATQGTIHRSIYPSTHYISRYPDLPNECSPGATHSFGGGRLVAGTLDLSFSRNDILQGGSSTKSSHAPLPWVLVLPSQGFVRIDCLWYLFVAPLSTKCQSSLESTVRSGDTGDAASSRSRGRTNFNRNRSEQLHRGHSTTYSRQHSVDWLQLGWSGRFDLHLHFIVQASLELNSSIAPSPSTSTSTRLLQICWPVEN